MADNNWIKLNRSIWECFLWDFNNPKYGLCWIDMLLMANYKDKKIMFGGKIEVIPRGSFVTSMVKLAERWKVDRATVKRLLNLLQDDGMITYTCNNKRTSITIVKYDIYQSFVVNDATAESTAESTTDPTTDATTDATADPTAESTTDPTTDATADPTADTTQHKKIKEDKELNKYIYINCASDVTPEAPKSQKVSKGDIDNFFERIWKLYPNKKGKGKVSDAKKKILYQIGFDELSRAVERYKTDLAKEDWRQAQNGSTFFNSGYIDYLDANYTPSGPKTSGRQQPVRKEMVPDWVKKRNGFNNYDQREYSDVYWAELERKQLEQTYPKENDDP